MDPPPPVEAAGSSLLYSREFHEAVRDHLAPGGIFQTWYPGSDENVGPIAMSLAAVSKHLIVLEKAGLVRREKLGRVHSLTLDAQPMREAEAWLETYRQFWEGNLDQFESYLAKLQSKKNKQDDN